MKSEEFLKDVNICLLYFRRYVTQCHRYYVMQIFVEWLFYAAKWNMDNCSIEVNVTYLLKTYLKQGSSYFMVSVLQRNKYLYLTYISFLGLVNLSVGSIGTYAEQHC